MKPPCLRFGFLFLLVVIFNACAHYWYFGTKDDLDSTGKMRQVLVYWNRTERKFWFDSIAGAVRVKTQCGSTIVFEEKEDGIIFHARPNDQPVGGESVSLGGVCGRILSAKSVGDLTEGELWLEVQCQPTVDEFSSEAVHYLRSGRHSFQINRQEKPEDNPPDVNTCPAP